MAKVQITYFPFKGRQAAFVLLLEDQQIPYDYVPVEFANWREVKQKGLEDGTLPFGQIPQLKDGDLYLVQSSAIVRHLARKHGLYGKDSVEAAKCDMYEEGITDMRNDAMKLLFADITKAPEEIKKTVIPKHAPYFEAILKRGGTDYLVGDSVTYVDYLLTASLDSMTEMIPGLLDSFPLLKAHHDRMHARPNIAAYRASGREPPSWYSVNKPKAAA